jgi:hypothetical protein
MNLEHTTLLDVILYLLMVLSIIVLIIGACIGLELMISGRENPPFQWWDESPHYSKSLIKDLT